MMVHGPLEKPTTDAFELRTVLTQFGLSQYEERLQDNGFEDWETVTAITETDMAEMDFRRGDRRKLQRVIHEHSSASASYRVYEARYSPLSSEGLPTLGQHSELTPQSSQQAARTTRPYRRHPKPDSNAPCKPKTAYVLFGEHVRQDPALSDSSFTEIAKETGKRWREMPHEERTIMWETPAAERLQRHKKELERYKQTENYWSYQTYLERFEQQRHNPESMIRLDNRVLSTSEPAISGHLPASQEEIEATRQEIVDTDALGLEGGSQDTAQPIKDVMQEVRHISKALDISTHLTGVTAFPAEGMTSKAVEAFVQGTGSLLYLWNPTEGFDLVRSVYHSQSDLKPVYATEVFAMSAVGSYCDGDVHTMLLRDRFFHLFLCMLSSPSDMCDLRRMRLLACLAICRFTSSIESTRRLMCKRLMLFEFGHYRLTTRSISPQHGEAGIDISIV
jgi:hypothetical protein